MTIVINYSADNDSGGAVGPSGGPSAGGNPTLLSPKWLDFNWTHTEPYPAALRIFRIVIYTGTDPNEVSSYITAPIEIDPGAIVANTLTSYRYVKSITTATTIANIKASVQAVYHSGNESSWRSLDGTVQLDPDTVVLGTKAAVDSAQSTGNTALIPVGVGDGTTSQFLYVGPTLTRTDWQGTQTLYTTPRTNLSLQSENYSNSAWTNISCTITADSLSAPNGTMTMDKVVGTNATTSYLQQATNVSSGTNYTESVYVAASDSVSSRVRIFDSSISTELARVQITWNAGVPSVASTAGAGFVSCVIVPMGGGIYRVMLTFNTGSYTAIGRLIYPASDNTAKGIYIWGSHLALASEGQGYIPTTTAPVTLTDYAVTNGLATLSPIPAKGAVLRGIATNAEASAAAAQTAANNAQTAANTANTALSNIASDNILSPGEKPAVVLDYANITNEQAGIDAQADAYAVSRSAYDSAVSALTSYLGTLPGWNVIPGSDVAIDGPTFRQKFADVYSTRQALLNAIYAKAKALADAAQTTGNTALIPVVVGDGTTNQFLYVGPTVTKTDWQGTQTLYTTARTNLCPYSQALNSWATANGSTVTPDSTTDPLGTSTADMVTGSSSTYNSFIYVAPTIANGTVCRFSVWAKNVNSLQSSMFVRNSVNAGWIFINWSGSTITSLSLVGNATNATFQDFGNGWYRISFTVTTTETNQYFRLYPTFNADGASCYFWGAQIETGTTATSYIPTTTAPVTVTDYTVTNGLATLAPTPAKGVVLRGVATNAEASAAAAQTAANSALAALATIASDSWLSKGEKPQAIKDYNDLNGSQADLVAKASAVGVSSAAFTGAMTTLGNYLTGLIPSWNDTTSDTAITAAAWNTDWASAYTERIKLINAITAAVNSTATSATSTAAWGNITGTSAQAAPAGGWTGNHGAMSMGALTATSGTFSGALTVGSSSGIGSLQLITGGASPIVNRLTFGTDNTGYGFAISKNVSGTVTDLIKISDNGNFSVTGIGIFSGGLNVNRVNSASTGILYYSSGFTAWQTYMSNAGAASGVSGTVVAPTGTYVTTWGLRNFIENIAGYGWTWESGTKTSTTPSIVAELSSNTGNFRTIGSISAASGTFSGAITATTGMFTGTIDTTSSGGLSLKTGLFTSTPSNSTDAYVGVQNTGGPGGSAGDLILIPRSSTGVDCAIRFFTGQTTPVQRLVLDTNGAATFSSSVSMGALTATTGIFSGLITANGGISVAASQGITIGDGTPSVTTNKLYQAGSLPFWNGSQLITLNSLGSTFAGVQALKAMLNAPTIGSWATYASLPATTDNTGVYPPNCYIYSTVIVDTAGDNTPGTLYQNQSGTWVRVGSGSVIAGKITAANVSAGSIGASAIVANSITSAQINASSISAAILTAGSVTATQIAANTITSAQISAGSITGDRLTAGTITATQIAANTITSAQISAGSITGDRLTAGTITATQIAAGAIGATALSSVIAMTTTLTSTVYTAGTSSTPGTGFKLNGSSFSVTYMDGTTDTAIAEFGGNVKIGGYKASVIANRVMGNSTTFSSNSTWVCPEGITSVELMLQGKGGNGGSASASNYSGGGGGAGGYYKNSITVAPGTTYYISFDSDGLRFRTGSYTGTVLYYVMNGTDASGQTGGAGGNSNGGGLSGYAQTPEGGYQLLGGTGANGLTFNGTVDVLPGGSGATSPYTYGISVSYGNGGKGQDIISKTGTVSSTPPGTGGAAIARIRY